MEKLFKLMSLTLLTALISSCNLFKPYEVIYETKMRNYKSNEINYDDFISLSLINFSSLLYEDSSIALKGKESKEKNILFSPFSSFLNFLTIEVTSSDEILKSYNINKENGEEMLKKFNKFKNVSFSNNENSVFKFTNLIAGLNIGFDKNSLKKYSKDFSFSSYFAKDKESLEEAISDKLSTDLETKINYEYKLNYDSSLNYVSGLKIKEKREFSTTRHVFKDINGNGNETRFGVIPTKYHIDKVNEVLSFKGETTNFDMIFVINSNEDKTIDDLPLEEYFSNYRRTYSLYTDENGNSKNINIAFPFFTYTSSNSISNYEEVAKSREIYGSYVGNKVTEGSISYTLEGFLQDNYFEINEDGFEGVSISTGGAPGAGVPDLPDIYLDKPFYLFITLKNDIPIFAMRVNTLN